MMVKTDLLEYPYVFIRCNTIDEYKKICNAITTFNEASDHIPSNRTSVLKSHIETSFPGTSFSFELTDVSDSEESRVITEEDNIRNKTEWRDVIKNDSPGSFPVVLSRNGSILMDAVQAYKAFSFIPFMAPYHFHRLNICVTYKNEDNFNFDDLRLIFFNSLFSNVNEVGNYFASDSNGFITIAPGKTSLEDLDVYEAFGFFLAKAFQNNFGLSIKLKKIYFDMIHFCEIQFNPSVLSQFNIQTNAKSSLSRINFNNFRTYHNLKDFYIQLLMIALGFSRGCPAHIVHSLAYKKHF